MSTFKGYTYEPSIVRNIDTDSFIDLASGTKLGFGIDFLDDSLFGMLPNDLVLIGAKSGYGKSQLAINIAKSNACLGKKVLYIALEAEPNEVEMRLRYQIESSLFFKDQDRDKSVKVNYRLWRFGQLKKAFDKYKVEATGIFIDRYRDLMTVYIEEHFGAVELKEVLKQSEKDVDLVVLDHLHYLDLQAGNDKNSQISAMMKEIRRLNLFYNKPFVVVAHLRKDVAGILPQLEEFMGSSDIGKIATTCIMIAPKPEGYDSRLQTQDTCISIPKSRTGGFGNLCGIVKYSLTHQQYLMGYKIARGSRLNDKIDIIKEEDYPDWAKKS